MGSSRCSATAPLAQPGRSSAASRRAPTPRSGAGARDTPATLVAFDLLHQGRESLLELTYRERRERLEALALDGESWRTPAYHRGDGNALRAAAKQQGLAGVVGKRLDSIYRPGERTRDWREIPVRRR